MGIVAWIILGLVAGAVAKFIMPGQQGGGIILHNRARNRRRSRRWLPGHIRVRLRRHFRVRFA